jgi:uncharacterized iron-regulated protein
MKKTIVLSLALLFFILTAMKGDKPAYRIYTTKGKSADWADIVKDAQKADLIFFGELHGNPICHWLELELARELYASVKDRKLVIGAEMLERDNQLLVDEYISKMIRKKDFESEAKLWPSYKTDYAPIIDFARENGLKVVASNVPRRYAALVNLKGFEGLDSINALERGLMAPLPLRYVDTLECYRSIAKSVGDGMPAHMTANLGKAQALKDATMAHFILKNGVENENIFLHINGSYHSDHEQGIVWYARYYINRTNFPLKIMTISCIEQENPDTISAAEKGKADYIIVIPSSMTRTH